MYTYKTKPDVLMATIDGTGSTITYDGTVIYLQVHNYSESVPIYVLLDPNACDYIEIQGGMGLELPPHSMHLTEIAITTQSSGGDTASVLVIAGVVQV